MSKRNYNFADDADATDLDSEISLTSSKGQDKDPDDKDIKDEDEPAASDFDDLHPGIFDTPDEKDEDEEGEEAKDEGEPDDGEEEDSGRSKDPFRKRLARAERLIEEAREEARAATKRSRELERTYETRQSETERTAKKAAAEAKLVDVRSRLTELVEEGTNTAGIVAAQEELADVKADLRLIETDEKRSKEFKESAPDVSSIVAKKASRWRRAHPKYTSDPVFAQFAKAIDKQLASEGFDPEDEDFWTELDSRVKERYPEEYRKKDDKKPVRKSPVRDMGRGDDTSVRRGGESFVRRGSKYVVTAAQKQNMRLFGMDPDNAEDLKTYIRENVKK
jgi:hypothetical protein